MKSCGCGGPGGRGGFDVDHRRVTCYYIIVHLNETQSTLCRCLRHGVHFVSFKTTSLSTAFSFSPYKTNVCETINLNNQQETRNRVMSIRICL